MYGNITINAGTRYETFCLVKLFLLLGLFAFSLRKKFACLSTIVVNKDEYTYKHFFGFQLQI